MSSDTKYLYRYWKAWETDFKTGNPVGRIHLDQFPVISQTDKTCRIICEDGIERNILRGEGKRHAHETKEWAWYSFQRRLKTEKRILTTRLDLITSVQGLSPSDVKDRYAAFEF